MAVKMAAAYGMYNVVMLVITVSCAPFSVTKVINDNGGHMIAYA